MPFVVSYRVPWHSQYGGRTNVSFLKDDEANASFLILFRQPVCDLGGREAFQGEMNHKVIALNLGLRGKSIIRSINIDNLIEKYRGESPTKFTCSLTPYLELMVLSRLTLTNTKQYIDVNIIPSM